MIMKTNIKDLEVLQKYLSEEELKEVAKEVAYNAFKSSLGVENPHSRSNINFHLAQGAYEAVKQHITENDFREEEFVEGLKDKVKEIIEGLTWYRLPLDVVVEEIVAEKRDEIRTKVDEIWKEWMNEDKDVAGSLYSYIKRSGADCISEYLIETFEESIKNKFKNQS